MRVDFAPLNSPIVVNRIVPVRSSDKSNIFYEQTTRPDGLSNVETTVIMSYKLPTASKASTKKVDMH